MVMIALPFALGRFERGGFGRRVLFGAILGMMFYLIDQVVAQIGLLAEVNLAVTATAPAALLFVSALLLLRRIQ